MNIAACLSAIGSLANAFFYPETPYVMLIAALFLTAFACVAVLNLLAAIPIYWLKPDAGSNVSDHRIDVIEEEISGGGR